MNNTIKRQYENGVLGLMVGDALGVPVEFYDRRVLKMRPVEGMIGYGTHNQPEGTWSDDSSMVIATLDSLRQKQEINYEDMMNKFSNWLLKGDYTPFGEVFDVGKSTYEAIMRYQRGVEPTSCGGIEETDNGNGGLMRILPICIYLVVNNYNDCEAMEVIYNTTSLTHRHTRSQVGSMIYYFCVKEIISNKRKTLELTIQSAIQLAYSFYNNREEEERKEFSKYSKLGELSSLKEDEISSSGYVVDTLIASLWVLTQHRNYEESLLHAVNLGGDTDTIGAVAGGLAGLYYGVENIPTRWLAMLKGIVRVEGMIDLLS